jgi:hypothetical protein
VRFWLLLMVLGGVGTGVASAAAAPATVTFTYVREGMLVPRYEMTLAEDGSGSYVATLAPQGAATTERQQVTQPVTLSGERVAAIFAAARGMNRFNTNCASKAKVASTGAKTVSYTGPDGQGSCAYDYTENKALMQLTNVFYGIAMTLDLGRKLEADHRFDRLGLDADMETLVAQVKTGFAIDPGVLIAPVLHSIVDDTQVIQRVRLKAGELLEQAGH